MMSVLLLALAAVLLVGREQTLERLGFPARRTPARGKAAALSATSHRANVGAGSRKRDAGAGAADSPVPWPGLGADGLETDSSQVGGIVAETSQSREELHGEESRRDLSGPVSHHKTQVRRRSLLLAGGCGLMIVAVVLGVKVAGWGLVLAIAVGTAMWVLRRGAAERSRRSRADETTRVTVGLAMLLRAEQIPTTALSKAASDCPALAPVAAVARLGGDVPRALREAARTPGREGLARVAGAWRVAERTGAPIASVLLQVAEGLRSERELSGVVEAELAMARGSARIMAFLPFGALLLGSFVGANPLGFLLEHPLGMVLALAGVSLAAAGVVWTEKLAVRA